MLKKVFLLPQFGPPHPWTEQYLAHIATAYAKATRRHATLAVTASIGPGALNLVTAAGLATLGCADADVYGRPWMLPCAPAGTLRELVARLAATADRQIRVRQVPSGIVKALGIFVPLFRELAEMLYQWDERFVIDDRRFRARFHLQPTDVERAAFDTVEWAKRHYARAGAAGP